MLATPGCGQELGQHGLSRFRDCLHPLQRAGELPAEWAVEGCSLRSETSC